MGFEPYQVLIVASLVEREAKVPEDRAKIARVIYNRLFLDMPLQIDASLYYQQDGERPFSELKELDTPYNTYLHTGLPPTPIANPGRASIQAALHPAAEPVARRSVVRTHPQGQALPVPVLRAVRRRRPPCVRGDDRAARGERREGARELGLL